MKECSACKVQKKETEFYKRSDGASLDGLNYHCKSCQKDRKRSWYVDNRSRPEVRFKNLKATAKGRGLPFKLTKDQYAQITSKPCHYCNISIADSAGGSIDRLDSDKGYTFKNSVACCGNCNIGRNNIYTPEEWKIMIDALLRFRNGGEHTTRK